LPNAKILRFVPKGKLKSLIDFAKQNQRFALEKKQNAIPSTLFSWEKG